MADLTVPLTQQDTTPTSEGVARQHRALIDRPKDKGGLDGGPMGGELLLLALGGCFMSNLIAAAGARGVVACIVHNTLTSGVPLTVRRAARG